MTAIPIRTNLIPTCPRVLPVIFVIFKQWLAFRDAFLERGVVATRSMAVVTFAIVAGICFNARLGNAQPLDGTLVLHGNEFFSCYVVDDGPGLKTVYVTHRINAATATRFRVQPGPFCTMTYVSEVHNFPMTVGNAQDGMSVCYGTCLVGDIPIATVTYMSYGTSYPCAQLEIVPHPLAEVPETVDCQGRTIQTAHQDVNAGTVASGCGCPFSDAYPGAPHAFDCEPLPVHASTWGAIKALYRE